MSPASFVWARSSKQRETTQRCMLALSKGGLRSTWVTISRIFQQTWAPQGKGVTLHWTPARLLFQICFLSEQHLRSSGLGTYPGMQVEFNCHASSDAFKLGHFCRVSLSFKVLTIWKRMALVFCGLTLSRDVSDVSQQPNWDRVFSAGAPLKGWVVCPKRIASGAVAARWLNPHHLVVLPSAWLPTLYLPLPLVTD